MVLLAKSSAFWLASTCRFTLYIVTDIALSETYTADSFDALRCLMKHSCTKPSAHLQAIQPSIVLVVQILHHCAARSYSVHMDI